MVKGSTRMLKRYTNVYTFSRPASTRTRAVHAALDVGPVDRAGAAAGVGEQGQHQPERGGDAGGGRAAGGQGGAVPGGGRGEHAEHDPPDAAVGRAVERGGEQ